MESNRNFDVFLQTPPLQRVIDILQSRQNNKLILLLVMLAESRGSNNNVSDFAAG
ncbi:MolR family transcriptional regulator [Sesbania bispinosa]|nr:MolR family transcriptional regulator [Sesbania bispinosa]